MGKVADMSLDGTHTADNKEFLPRRTVKAMFFGHLYGMHLTPEETQEAMKYAASLLAKEVKEDDKCEP